MLYNFLTGCEFKKITETTADDFRELAIKFYFILNF